jgi:hypothetical protein
VYVFLCLTKKITLPYCIKHGMAPIKNVHLYISLTAIPF